MLSATLAHAAAAVCGSLSTSCAGLQASLWLVVSAGAAILLGIAFLSLFRHQPHAMTQATIISQVCKACSAL